MNILDIRFVAPIAVPGKSGLHPTASIYDGTMIVLEDGIVRLSAGADSVYVPVSAVLFFRAEQPVTKAKRGVK